MIIKGLSYLTDPNKQFVTKGGAPNVGGFVRVYLANTDDPAKTYCDFNGTMNPQEICLDNNGRAVIIADVSKAYRIEVRDKNGGLLWTVSPAYCIDSGIVEYAEDSDYLIAKASAIEGDDSVPTKTFKYTEMSKVGDGAFVDANNDIRLKKGVYHVSIVVNINVNPTEESRPWIEEVTLNLPTGYGYVSTLLDRSIRIPHSSSSPLVASFDYVVETDNTLFSIHLAGLGDNCYATLKPISIHKIAEVE